MLPSGPSPGSEPKNLANTQTTTHPNQNNHPVVSLPELEQQSGFEVRAAASPAEAAHQREIERMKLQHELNIQAAKERNALKQRGITFSVAAYMIVLTYGGAAYAALNGAEDPRKWGFGIMSAAFTIVTTFLYKSTRQ
jgi:hypothetical protein